METLIQEPPVDPLELALLRREVHLEKRRIQIVKENGVLFYKPHEKQYEFHASANYRFRHPRYGNQTGKSEMGGTEDLAFALGYRPWMETRFPIINGKGETVAWHEGYPGHPLATLGIPDHPTKGLIIGADWDKTKEVFTEREGTNQGKIFAYAPKGAIGQCTRNHSGAIDRIPIKHKSGGWSIIHFDTVKSYKQNPMGLESSIWDWIHVDEPCPEQMFKAAARGLMARNGKAWFPLTPLTEPWIQEMFSPDMEKAMDDIGEVVAGDKILLTASMYDNPYLTEEGREAYIALLSEDEKECRVQGIPTAFAGLVYKEFNWAKHVRGSLNNPDPPKGWTSWDRPPKNFCLRFAIDYHPRKPHHVLFIATSPEEYHYVYAEIFLSCLMVDLVGEIRCVLQLNDPTVPGLIDPLADTPNRVTDITPLEEVLRLGLPVIPATKDPHNGILKVKALLRERDRMGTPILQVNPACRRFLMEISRGYIWDGETNKPVKDKDDAMENFYRLCLQGLHYIEPSESSSYIVTRVTDPIVSNVIHLDEFQPFEEQRPARSKAFASRYKS